MITRQIHPISRRRFLGFNRDYRGLTPIGLMPRRLFAEGESPVTIIRNEAATAKIIVTKLLAVASAFSKVLAATWLFSTGRDGKLLLWMRASRLSRPAITEALATASAPIRLSIS